MGYNCDKSQVDVTSVTPVTSRDWWKFESISTRSDQLDNGRKCLVSNTVVMLGGFWDIEMAKGGKIGRGFLFDSSWINSWQNGTSVSKVLFQGPLPLKPILRRRLGHELWLWQISGWFDKCHTCEVTLQVKMWQYRDIVGSTRKWSQLFCIDNTVHAGWFSGRWDLVTILSHLYLSSNVTGVTLVTLTWNLPQS